MGLSKELSYEAGSFCHHCNSHRFLQPDIFKAFFSSTGTLGCLVCLAPSLFLLVYLHANVGPPVLQLPPCRTSSLPQLPISAPPTILNECFFFNSLVVGLLYSANFWQFWLFFVFKFVVGCVRKQIVSTYASILAGSEVIYILTLVSITKLLPVVIIPSLLPQMKYESHFLILHSHCR